MTTKIDGYFIRKELADRLKTGEKVPGYEIVFYEYDDMKPLNSKRVEKGDPDALIACDLLIGTNW